jgi:putative toxin-antitoxin system antitoxin component (TIGR02293 family)
MVTEVVRVLGLDETDIHTQKDLALLAQKGIPRSAVEHLAEHFDVNLKDLSAYLNVTLRSIQGYKKNELLSSNISDHLIQLAKLYVMGESTLGAKAFKEWLQLYNPALGIAPVDLLKTATGIETVKDELIRMEYSVFA